jgi:hypothetical protein
MKRVIFLAVIFLSINLFAQEQEKVDSTNYKKYEVLLKQINSQFQELQRAKLISDGQYYQSLEKLQTQAQTINQLFSEEKQKLAPKKEAKKLNK